MSSSSDAPLFLRPMRLFFRPMRLSISLPRLSDVIQTPPRRPLVLSPLALSAATRQTLEATREDVTEERLAAVVDRELIEALRFPVDRKAGWLPTLYLHRRAAAIVTTLVTAGAALALLLL